MKTCTISGDMMAEKSSDAYPMVNVCDDCYEGLHDDKDGTIISVESYDQDFGPECHFCGNTQEDECE